MAIDPLIRNNVTVTGNPTARAAMVFVNGLGYDQTFWSQVASEFASDYRLVLFDHAGSIESNQDYFRANQWRYLNVGGYATDLLEICVSLALSGDILLVGHSLGAMVGLLAARQDPSRFSGLVLIGASPRYMDTEGYRGGFSKADIDATYGALQGNHLDWSRQLASLAMGTPDRPTLTGRFADALARIPPDVMLTVLCSVLQMDRRAELGMVTTPTLVIQAREDYFVPPEVAQYLRDQIPNCRLAEIDAVGHLPHVSAPAQVVAAIRDFIG